MAQFTNQAQLSYNNSVRNSNIAVGEIQEALSASKTAVSTSYNVGTDVTYAISIVNSGDANFTGVIVTDNLGAYQAKTEVVPLAYSDGTLRYYINGVLQKTPAYTATDSLVVSGLSVPAASTVMLLYEAFANQYAPLASGSTITNQAVVSGTGFTPITVEATLPVQSEPNLTVTKSVSPVPVTENGTLTYTFVIQNYGNVAATAADNAAITDTFLPILKGLCVTFNSTAWSNGTEYNYSEGTGLFSSVAGNITVPAATYSQDAATGAWITNPGVSTLIISGTV